MTDFDNSICLPELERILLSVKRLAKGSKTHFESKAETNQKSFDAYTVIC